MTIQGLPPKCVDVMAYQHAHSAAGLELHDALRGNLDPLQRSRVLRAACCALLHFEDTKLAKFKSMAQRELIDDAIQEVLNHSEAMPLHPMAVFVSQIECYLVDQVTQEKVARTFGLSAATTPA